MQGCALRRAFVTFLRGFGQVMLQESALAGALFLVGIATSSVPMALGGMAGALSGVVTAKLCGCKTDDLRKGWYGYNGALVGIALPVFHQPGALLCALIVTGGALATVVLRAMLRRADHLPPYTAPFVLSTWGMLAIADLAGIASAVAGDAAMRTGEIPALLRGVGQVMFQGAWPAGLIFLAGLALHSRQAAAWALIGSALGLATARSLGYPEELAAAGIFGYNGALTGIALAARFRGDAVAPLLGIVLSTVATRGFQLAGIPALTAPFVLSSWAVGLAVSCLPPAARRP